MPDSTPEDNIADVVDKSSRPPEPIAVSNPPPEAKPLITQSSKSDTWATIPYFPEDLIPTLMKEFVDTLRSRHFGTFEAEYMCVKIGKDTHRWKLQGDR